jgi:hypothetical protein
MNIDGNNTLKPFDQDLNTTDTVAFKRVDVTDAIVDNSQLATKLYVDTNGGGGGGGNMTYVGTTPATNYIYKALASNGHHAVKSNIVDTGATVTVITTLQCLALDGQAMGGNLNIGNNQATVTILADCIADKFVKTGGGSSTEFLKSNGTVDTNTYLTTTTPSIVSGYALNPANRATTTITSSTKSYYYTVLLNQATIISGFTVYLDSGSDIFRMGIFRGNNIAGQTITLCGQSTGAVLNDTTVFNRRAITAVAGQNLTFSAGEYMTVAFHSQGSTNVFLGSAVCGVVLVELTWQSNTNYASAGFPATLNSTAILGGFTSRPCFELY